MILRSFSVACLGVAALAAATGPAAVTFNKDVLPILENRCQECHRQGEIAPMSFMTYTETRPWAKAIKAVVATRKMPPWTADPSVGHFANDRSLSQAEIDTLLAWVDSGSKEGNPKDAPKPREFATGWTIGQPDQIFEMPTAVEIPSSGVVDYTYEIIHTNFKQDMWIQAAEARAGSRRQMHHVIAFLRPPGSTWFQDRPIGVPFIPGHGAHAGQVDAQEARQMATAEMIVGWAPGAIPLTLEPGQAKLIPAGSDLVLQLHYTPNGASGSDKTKIGLIFSKEPPKERVTTLSAINFFLKIPPGDANYESHSQFTVQHDVKLVSLMPHMHLRGKDFAFRAVYPTGETQDLLNVPHYDFNWQLTYDLKNQIVLPKGTRIECTAHYDNSPNNKFNPDPTKEVRWGDQTFEEMMIGFFDVAFDANLDPRLIRVRQAPKAGSE
ncbi:MAG TPA: hypothetical protein VKU01_12595 [Bryobacteraceae bacterium]|nr:hypothetical protein [Bryobacteraceae bacterium]